MVNGETNQDDVFRIFRNSVEAPGGRNTTQPSSFWSGYVTAPYDNNDSSTPSNYNIIYIDTPGTTSQQQYGLGISCTNGSSNTFYLNGTVSGGTTGSQSYEVMVSSVIAWEIAQ
jgi:hypothetical protein